MVKDEKRRIIKEVVSKFKTKISPKQLSRGMEIEREHSSYNGEEASPATDVVNGNKKKIAKIATVHLKEDPKYYTKLDKAGL